MLFNKIASPRVITSISRSILYHPQLKLFMSTEIRKAIEDAIASAPVVLFMKGTPEFPQCGFSAIASNLYEEKQKKNLKDTNKISMGIALRHFDIACNKFGLEVDYSKMDVKKRLAKEYYITATLK